MKSFGVGVGAALLAAWALGAESEDAGQGSASVGGASIARDPTLVMRETGLWGKRQQRRDHLSHKALGMFGSLVADEKDENSVWR
jgi:hypothetical protein